MELRFEEYVPKESAVEAMQFTKEIGTAVMGIEAENVAITEDNARRAKEGLTPNPLVEPLIPLLVCPPSGGFSFNGVPISYGDSFVTQSKGLPAVVSKADFEAKYEPVS